MAVACRSIRIAIAQASPLSPADADAFERAGVELVTAGALTDMEDVGRVDVFAIDLGLAGASDFLRSRAVENGPPAIALVGRDGPCRTVEQSLLRAEVDGAALALPKPAAAEDIVAAALAALNPPPATRRPARPA